MQADFRQGMALNEVSAEALNRIQKKTLEPHVTRLRPSANPVMTRGTIVKGVNNTSGRLYHGSIVALDPVLPEVGGGEGGGDGDEDLYNANPIFNFFDPIYPQPEPDPESGIINFPYPEQRLAIIRTNEPVERADICQAAITGLMWVSVDFNRGGGGRYATFIDGDVTKLQVCDSGPAEIIGYRGHAVGEDVKCLIFFPVGGQAYQPDGNSDGDDKVIFVQKSFSIGIVTDRASNGKQVTVQPLQYSLENYDLVPYGEKIYAATAYYINGKGDI